MSGIRQRVGAPSPNSGGKQQQQQQQQQQPTLAQQRHKRRLNQHNTADPATTSSWEISSASSSSQRQPPILLHPHPHQQQLLPHAQIPYTDRSSYQGLGYRLDAMVYTSQSSSSSLSLTNSAAANAPYYQHGTTATSQRRIRIPHKPPPLPRLEDFHTLYRTAHHVPDGQYRDYLRGSLGRGGHRREAPIFTRTCWGQSCAGFSFVAVLFLVFVGILLDTQPLYIKGSLPPVIRQTTTQDSSSSSSSSNTRVVVQYLLPTTTRLPAARAAYQAALAYLVTMILSLYSVYPGWFQSQIQRRQGRYQDIPDHQNNTNSNNHDNGWDDDDNDSTIPTFHTFDNNNNNNNNSSNNDEARVMSPYQPSLWNRLTAWLKQWLASREWYGAVHHQFRRPRKHMPKTI
jgi:hypothetical protein